MRDANLIGPWVRRFLLEHVIIDRNFSRNTQASYRDAMGTYAHLCISSVMHSTQL
jgi:hypothetical protein